MNISLLLFLLSNWNNQQCLLGIRIMRIRQLIIVTVILFRTNVIDTGFDNQSLIQHCWTYWSPIVDARSLNIFQCNWPSRSETDCTFQIPIRPNGIRHSLSGCIHSGNTSECSPGNAIHSPVFAAHFSSNNFFYFTGYSFYSQHKTATSNPLHVHVQPSSLSPQRHSPSSNIYTSHIFIPTSDRKTYGVANLSSLQFISPTFPIAKKTLHIRLLNDGGTKPTLSNSWTTFMPIRQNPLFFKQQFCL
jgi:hypothetical protein